MKHSKKLIELAQAARDLLQDVKLDCNDRECVVCEQRVRRIDRVKAALKVLGDIDAEAP